MNELEELRLTLSTFNTLKANDMTTLDVFCGQSGQSDGKNMLKVSFENKFDVTIDNIVKVLCPLYVGVNNPKQRGVKTSGSTLVDSYEYDIDEKILYITIK